MPKEICDKLVSEMQAVPKDPAVVSRFDEVGAVATPSTLAQFREKSTAEIAKFMAAIDKTGISIQN